MMFPSAQLAAEITAAPVAGTEGLRAFAASPRVTLACLLLFVAVLRPENVSAQIAADSSTNPVAADLRLPALDRSELTPEKRDPETVAAGERNPFGFVAPAATVAATAEAESEENKLRRILAGMRVSGNSSGSGVNSALLGPILVREGETVPRLFADQAEILRVQSITDREVVIVFVDKEQGKEPRTINLPVDLSARVKSLMPGEFFGSLVTFDGAKKVNLPPLKSEPAGSLAERLKGEGVQLQPLVERTVEFMGEAEPSERGEPSNAAYSQ